MKSVISCFTGLFFLTFSSLVKLCFEVFFLSLGFYLMELSALPELAFLGASSFFEKDKLSPNFCSREFLSLPR